MSATARETVTRTAASLQAEVRTLETNLAQAQRAQSAAKSRLPTLIASGDADEITECRKSIQRYDKQITELVASVEETREALQITQERGRAAARSQAYGALKSQLTATRKAMDELADKVVGFAAALKKARSAVEEDEGEMRRAGVMPDPYILRLKLVALVEILLHLESDGIVGQTRGLDSPHQLRQNGRADLKKAVREYETLTLQRARHVLGVTDE